MTVEQLREIVPGFLEFLTLIGGIIVIITLLSFLLNKKFFKALSGFGKDNYLVLGLIISAIATLGSLFYSNIMGYTPCQLCWWQRIFMYSQTFMFGFALIKKERNIFKYSILLSIIGGLISVFHYFLQLGLVNPEITGCDVIGYSASCSASFFVSYGYITIPMMALTAFVLLIILGINYKKSKI